MRKNELVKQVSILKIKNKKNLLDKNFGINIRAEIATELDQHR